MNKMIFNLLVLFFSSVNYSCNRQQIIEETTRDERSHDIITKQDILMSLLNDSSLVLNTSLKDYTDLVNLSPGFFLFVSEENCLSCVDSVMEYLEKKCSSDINIKVIFYTKNLGSFYSLKYRIKNGSLEFFYTANIAEEIRNINEVFFFRTDKRGRVNHVYIPFGNSLTIESYFKDL